MPPETKLSGRSAPVLNTVIGVVATDAELSCAGVRTACACRAGRYRALGQAFAHADGRRHDLCSLHPPETAGSAKGEAVGVAWIRSGGLRCPRGGARRVRGGNRAFVGPGTGAPGKGSGSEDHRYPGVFRLAFPMAAGGIEWGRGRVATVASTTIVAVETGAGIAGCGESGAIEGIRLQAFPGSISATLARLALVSPSGRILANCIGSNG